MSQKSHYAPSKADSKARRAPSHHKKVKVDKARDQDWKRETASLTR
jgi:hypothetical protein